MLENENYLTKISKTSDISEELIKAMDLIATTRDSELAFDKTITAEIIRLSDAELGEYYIKYQHGIFKAYTLNETTTYREGDTVYVKIPQGDFSSGKKIIEGKTKVSPLSESDYDYLSNQIVEMNVFYKEEEHIYSLNASAEEQELIIYENSEVENSESFINLFNAYPRIKISGDFKTIFPSVITPFGEFGLKVEFYYKPNSSQYSISYFTVEKKLSNIYNFIGNLNEYLIFSPQYALYDFKDMNVILTGIKKISLYVKDYNKNIDLKVDGAYNINVQNIRISFMDKLDNSDSLYYVGIRSKDGDGTILKNDLDSISLEGVFYYSGKELISDKTKCQCLWYRRNPEITETHSKYDRAAGPGWEKVENNVLTRLENGEITATQARTYLDQSNVKTYALYGSRLNALETASKQYRKQKNALSKMDPEYSIKLVQLKEEYEQKKNSLIVEFQPAVEDNILHVRGMDVYQEMDYQFVVLYGTERKFSKTITIIKNNIQRFNLIKTLNENGVSFLQLYDSRRVEGINEITADWYIELSNGDYLSGEKNTNSLEMTQYEIYPEVTFYANIIVSETQRIPMKYKIKNYLNKDDIKVYFSGADTFIYNDNYESFNYGQINELKINIVTNNSRIINPNSIHWYFVNREGINKFEIASNTQYPNTVDDNEGSMIRTLLTNANKDVVTIGIRERFDSSRTQNLLKLVIESEDGESFEFTKMINFIKQGSHSLNPGAYEMTLQYFDEKGQETSEYFLYSNSRSSTVWTSVLVKPKIVTASGQTVESGAWCKNVLAGTGEEDSIHEYKYDVEITALPINVQCKQLQDGIYSITKTTSFITDYSGNSVDDYPIKEQYFIRFGAKINIIDKNGHEVYSTCINKFFPLPLVVGDLDATAFTDIYIPRYIKYDSYGENPIYDTSAVSFKYQDKTYPYNKYEDYSCNNLELIKNTSSTWTLKPVLKYKGSNFPLYSNIELNYETLGKTRQQLTPMGSLLFEIGSMNYFVWPVAMTIEGDLTKEIVGYSGEGIFLNDNEVNTQVTPAFVTGNTSQTGESNGQFGGVVIGTESNDSSDTTISGVYLYDQENYTPSNILKTDGSFNLGAGSIICKITSGQKQYEFDLDFIKAMVKYLQDNSTILGDILGKKED